MTDTSQPDPATTSRREFLSRSVKAAATVAAAGGVAAWLVQRANRPVVSDTVALGDFRVGSEARMAVVKGTDRAELLARGLAGVGGLDAYLRPGERVLIKANVAFASPASLGATAHPDLVGELVRLCLAAGAADVIVTDNPINDPANCFTLSGVGRAATEAGGRVMLPKTTYFQPTSVDGGRLIQDWPLLYEPFDGVDKVIGVAPVKDHDKAVASMTMKNWYGLLGGRRNLFHQDIHNTIKELAMMVRPTLVVLDGVQTMVSNGPTGGSLADLTDTQTMVVSTDQVAADAYGARELLGLSLDELPYIGKAEAAGVGTTDYERLLPSQALEL